MNRYNSNIISRFIYAIIALLASIPLGVSAESNPSAKVDSTATAGADLRAGLITCYPGPEIYELCGHEAIRIYGTDEKGEYLDSVWNYGIFDFNSPNFAYRFAKGETDYIVAGYPLRYFLPEYERRGSRVVEQQLNMNQEEIAVLRRLLQINSLPRNRTYRYNYVRDNCSTRVLNMIEASVAPLKVDLPDSVSYSSFRDAMRHFHRNYPWYQFGIDLALGGGIDLPITSREETFAPVLLEEKMQGAKYSNGEPVVRKTIILNEGLQDATLPATPWWATPMAVAVLLLLISLGVSIYEYKKKIAAKIWMTIFFSLLGLGGCVIWFLVFISSHDSTSPNLLFLWLNPLQLVLAVCIWWRSTRPAAMAMALVNLIIILVMSLAWPLQAQSANPAFFPLWAATFILSLTYAIIYPRLGYKNEGLYLSGTSEKRDRPSPSSRTKRQKRR